MRLADYVLSAIADQGVKHCFFVAGGASGPLNDALGRSRITPVACLHEQAAAIAAEAYARTTGGLGLCMTTAGPGATNAITGCLGAWLDSTPVVFLSGQVKREDLRSSHAVRQMGVQESPIVEMVKPITKYALTITAPEDIRYELEKAIHLTTIGRRGPVWLDLPLDVQAAEVEHDTMRPLVSDWYETDEKWQAMVLQHKVAECVRMLESSKRPVLLVGNGARSLRRVWNLHRCQIPVLTSPLAADLVPDDHPLCFGRPGNLAPRYSNFVLQNADLLIILGCRCDMAMTAYDHDHFAPKAKKVMVDIDEAEISKMRCKIHLPIVADAGAFVEELDRQVPPLAWPEWVKRCREWKEKYPVVLPEHRAASPLSMYAFSEILSQELPNDALIVTGSSGAAIEIFNLVHKSKAGQRCFYNRGTGSMGFGLPAAIGAALASGKPVVCVDGDGGFQMNVQELATLARLGLPVTVFVINNDGYASIRASQRAHFDRCVGADFDSGLSLPSLAKVVRAYGVAYYSTLKDDNIVYCVQEALDYEPKVVQVFVDPNEDRIPRVLSKQRADGSMESGKLENLYPFLPRDEFDANMDIGAVSGSES